jgi:CheY-like chemotaxis protein
MNLLVVHGSKSEREAIAALFGAHHRVEAVASNTAALQCLDRGCPDVVLLQWASAGSPPKSSTSADKPAADVIRRVRSVEDARHTYVVTLLDKGAAGAIQSAIAAGADDFVFHPLLRDEVIARAEAPIRIGRWRAGASQGRSMIPLGDGFDARGLAVFRDLGVVVGDALAEMLGPLDIVDGCMASGKLLGASIPLVIPTEHAEIRVSIVVDAALASVLSELVLGTPDSSAEELNDMLREVANTAGGAVKRGAALEKVLLTTGLPVSEARGATPNDFTKCWTARFSNSRMELGIIGEVLQRAKLRVPIAKLNEGMVIEVDIRNEAGALVLPMGTRLTLRAVERLSSLLGPRFMVEVSAGS